MSTQTQSIVSLTIAPAQVVRGFGAIEQTGSLLARFGDRPLLVGGDHSLDVVKSRLKPILKAHQLTAAKISYGKDCSEAALTRMKQTVADHGADFVIGVGGGKALDAAKLLADQCSLPIVTIPTTAATCAAWTALSNVYSEQHAFLYDVSLARCPDLLVLDYDLIATAPQRTLIAGIGDAIAKWYEASISSGHSEKTLLIAASTLR